MRDGLTLWQVEVIVSLDTTTVSVRWHGVPHSTWVELGETELELARTFLEHIVDDELVNGTVVSLFHCAYWSPNSCLERTLTSVEGDPLSLVVLVSSS